MRRSFAVLVALGLSLLSVPTPAHAQVPSKIEIETCWYGVCLGVTSRYYTVITQPIIAPNQGQLWNSQGMVGDFFYDPATQSLSFFSYRFPVGIYSGSIINGCLSGTAQQYYYVGYASFESVRGCP